MSNRRKIKKKKEKNNFNFNSVSPQARQYVEKIFKDMNKIPFNVGMLVDAMAMKAFKNKMPVDDFQRKYAIDLFSRNYSTACFVLDEAIRRKNPRPIVALMLQVYEGINKNYTKLETMFNGVTCKEGCYYCCYQKLSVTIPELLMISIFNKIQPDVLPINKDRIKASKFYDIDDCNFGEPCSFLENERCTIYPIRPLMCRAWHVFSSKEICKKKYIDQNLKDDDVEMLTQFTLHGHLIQNALQLASEKFGLKPYIQLEGGVIHSFENDIFQDWIDKKL